MASATKDPVKVRAGTIGASKRWNNPANRRVVRIDSLEPSVAAAVRALIAADQETKKAAADVSETSPATADAEVSHAGLDSAA